jgi:hypothetical protein
MPESAPPFGGEMGGPMEMGGTSES